jgi:hypothetical protein
MEQRGGALCDLDYFVQTSSSPLHELVHCDVQLPLELHLQSPSNHPLMDQRFDLDLTPL